MANKKKNYPNDTLVSIQSIGASLTKLMESSKMSMRGVSQVSGIAVNSIKSVLQGATANIATYDMVARALGSSLIEVVQKMDNKPMEASENPENAPETTASTEEVEEVEREEITPQTESEASDNDTSAPGVAEGQTFFRKNTVV